MRYLLVFIFISFALSNSTYSADREIISVAAIDWCPQMCSKGSSRGYIYEIIKAFAKSKNYEFSVSFMPWRRAIREVSNGEYLILLSPTKREAPKLIFGNSEVGTQKMCFYVNKSSTWQYKGIESIVPSMRILSPLGASLVELDDFARNHPEQFFLIPKTDEINMSKLLMQNRGSAFLFTQKSMDNFLREKKYSSQLKEVGCLKNEMLHVGFSPINSEKSRRLALELDQFLEQSYKSGFIDKILKKYSLKNWRSSK
ncbi:MAG: transporter substrate-binding domain-containing protein [Bacteriovoracaceae bacterium]|nr:transporter substrate-binding domain-containing protein [Bacteriovoracaceae bacterium]